jgi:ubiquinone/menaquinone biosynthesis C-methylase UbiE
VGVIEQLGFPDQSFAVVPSTFMLHHLLDDLKRQGLAEIARVLKPGGRLFVVDLKGHALPVGEPPNTSNCPPENAASCWISMPRSISACVSATPSAPAR